MIKINGVVISGDMTGGSYKSISTVNGKVYIDGKAVDTGDTKEIKIEVTGNVNSIEADYAQEISVTGDVTTIRSGSGDVNVQSAVLGNIQSGSGDIECTHVNGSVQTGSGNVHAHNVGGEIRTGSGNIKYNQKIG